MLASLRQRVHHTATDVGNMSAKASARPRPTGTCRGTSARIAGKQASRAIREEEIYRARLGADSGHKQPQHKGGIVEVRCMIEGCFDEIAVSIVRAVVPDRDNLGSRLKEPADLLLPTTTF